MLNATLFTVGALHLRMIIKQSAYLFFKHFIMTYTPLCWLHPSCTTVYIYAYHIYALTQTHTGTHARTAAHAGNICNYIFLCLLSTSMLNHFFKKTEQRVILAKHQGLSHQVDGVGTRHAGVSKEATGCAWGVSKALRPPFPGPTTSFLPPART